MERPAPAQMDGRLGTHGPLPGNQLGTGGPATGVVAPARHCCLNGTGCCELDPTLALSKVAGSLCWECFAMRIACVHVIGRHWLDAEVGIP